jgi:hypothetical protein
MRFFVTSKAKVGSAFNANGFTLRVMMHYPAAQKAAFEDSMKELVEVDKFVEERDGEYRLTQAGAIHTTPEPPDLSRGGRGGPRGPRR